MTKLSRGKTEQDLDAFMRDSNAKFPVVHDKDGQIFRSYSVGPIPALAVVKDGTIVFRNHPNYLTDDMIEDYLAAAE